MHDIRGDSSKVRGQVQRRSNILDSSVTGSRKHLHGPPLPQNHFQRDDQGQHEGGRPQCPFGRRLLRHHQTADGDACGRSGESYLPSQSMSPAM